MSDYIRFIDLLNAFGITGHTIKVLDDGDIFVIIEEFCCDKVEGYTGFYTRFLFDKDGKFVMMGAYE